MNAQIDKIHTAIFTPMYNNASSIIRAIESVRMQTNQNYLHYIYDDFSSDASRNLVTNYIAQHPTAHIIFGSGSEQRGRSHVLNVMMHEALLNNPTYFAFLEPTDVWHPNHLATSVDILEREKVAMVYSVPYFYDDKGNRLTPYGVPLYQQPIYQHIYFANTIFPSSVLMKRACMEAVGEFSEDLKMVFYWDYWLRVMQTGFRVLLSPIQSIDTTIVTQNEQAYNRDVDILRTKHTIYQKPAAPNVVDRPLKVHVNCGSHPEMDYVNVDSTNNPLADIWCDDMRLPFPPNSVDVIMAHVTHGDFVGKKFSEKLFYWKKLLKFNGKIELTSLGENNKEYINMTLYKTTD